MSERSWAFLLALCIYLALGTYLLSWLALVFERGKSAIDACLQPEPERPAHEIDALWVRCSDVSAGHRCTTYMQPPVPVLVEERTDPVLLIASAWGMQPRGAPDLAALHALHCELARRRERGELLLGPP